MPGRANHFTAFGRIEAYASPMIRVSQARLIIPKKSLPRPLDSFVSSRLVDIPAVHLAFALSFYMIL